jgi:hypothetical protein
VHNKNRSDKNGENRDLSLPAAVAAIAAIAPGIIGALPANMAATIRVLPPMRTNSTVDHDGGSACNDTFATVKAPPDRPTFLVVLTKCNSLKLRFLF